ncbi:hypothetical protein [Silvibacterium sp.]|uniref:hypothetical protein n=1 Tax=Silvibacterium sp. TaxID=1964179 RepID=UPI0039E5F298
MTDTRPNHSQDCAEFQEKLPDLFESQTDLSSLQHLKTCENCAALVRDLEYIAQQAKLLLPIHDPSPEVWDRIENAMQQDTASDAAAPATRS